MVIDAMTGTGANVRVVSADISQEDAVQRILATIRTEMPALAGIIHSAAVLDDHTLLEQTPASFQTVFAPKAIGAWHLHAHTQHEKLDFFVMYSSAASLLGSPGQANYCAANAFIDSLARERARLGLPAMSIQWGAFADVGLAAARESRSGRLANRGMTALTPAEGLDILHRLLEHPHAEIGVLRLDVRQWIEFYPAATRLPFLNEIISLEAPPEKDSTLARETLEKLQTTPPEERSWLLENLLTDQIGFVLQLDPSRIDRLAPLQSLGLDSLTSLELRNRLEALVGVKLPATVTFTYPTLEALARHLLDQLGLVFASTPAPSAPTREASHVDDLADLSDDELLRAGKEILG
jgi:NAD(P)-dependent dehydrogenase (short-subunit alcohol dehydrogenase family)/acyl carrier protein